MRHQKVRDILRADPVTVTPATSLKHVAEVLIEQNISAVPVLSLRGKFLGIVSETDLVRKEELQRDPGTRHSAHLSYRARRDLATAETAGEIMREPVATVRPDATLAEAARLMNRHEVSYLPVLEESGHLLGVVTSRDLLRELSYAFDDTKPLPGPDGDESPLTRGTHPPIAARRLT
jgi:CBS domain-containing protein